MTYFHTLLRDREILDRYFGRNGYEPRKAYRIKVELGLANVWIVYDALRRVRQQAENELSKTFQIEKIESKPADALEFGCGHNAASSDGIAERQVRASIEIYRARRI